MNTRAVDLLELEYLSETQRAIAESIGIKAYRELAYQFSGEKLYIADINYTLKQCRDKIIQANHDKLPVWVLCNILGISSAKYNKIHNKTK